jgi:phosphate/sulfate permease
MNVILALLIGAGAGAALAMLQLKLSNPQHLGIAIIGGAVAGVLANWILAPLVAGILAFIGQIAIVAAGGAGVVYGAQALGLFKSNEPKA